MGPRGRFGSGLEGQGHLEALLELGTLKQHTFQCCFLSPNTCLANGTSISC